MVADYGFNRYVAFGIFKPFDKQAVADFQKTFEVNGVQIDGGMQNCNYYYNFFLFKRDMDIRNLQEDFPNMKLLFKEIIDARTDQSTDPYPNYDGCRGDGRVNNPVIGMPQFKSDGTPKKDDKPDASPKKKG